MKKVILILLCLFITNKSISQNAGEIIGAIAGVAGAAAVAAIEVDLYQERWEVYATDYILKNYDYDAFELKINGFDKTRAFDPSTVSILAFNVSPINYADGTRINEEKFSLLVILDSGYMTEYGIDYTKVRFEKFEKERWNKLYTAYVELASKTKIKDNKSIPIYKVNTRKSKSIENSDENYDPIIINGQIYKFTGEFTTFQIATVGNKGLKFTNQLVLPFQALNGDTYFIKDYNEDFKIIYNERSMGLYIKEIGKLVQIKNKFVTEITRYLNN